MAPYATKKEIAPLADEGLSVNQIAKLLNDEDLTTAEGKAWHIGPVVTWFCRTYTDADIARWPKVAEAVIKRGPKARREGVAALMAKATPSPTSSPSAPVTIESIAASDAPHREPPASKVVVAKKDGDAETDPASILRDTMLGMAGEGMAPDLIASMLKHKGFRQGSGRDWTAKAVARELERYARPATPATPATPSGASSSVKRWVVVVVFSDGKGIVNPVDTFELATSILVGMNDASLAGAKVARVIPHDSVADVLMAAEVVSISRTLP